MTLDVVIVEDVDNIRDLSSQTIKMAGFNPLPFASALECIDYLKGLQPEQYPVAYFVDMRIPGELGKTDPREHGGPEKLFYFLREKEKLRNFYFVSGNTDSPYDQIVHRETEMPIYLKQAGLISQILEKIPKTPSQ